MRVVGGSLRGRRLFAPEDEDVRPTSDRAREALFNILTQGREGNVVQDATVLDAFAGSGALGIEALSRGASFATFIEKNRGALELLRQNLKALGLTERAEVLTGDATLPPPVRRPANLALLDPPYGSGLGPVALTALRQRSWLAPGALVSLELEKTETAEPPAGFTKIDERRYGRARLLIMRSD